MSVLTSLEQISLSMLQQLMQSQYSSEYIAILELYNIAKEIPSPKNWEVELKRNSSAGNHVKVLKSINFDSISMIESVQAIYKSAQLPEFEMDDWGDMLAFLTGELYPEQISYLLSQEKFNNSSISLVNAFGGQRTRYRRHGYESFLSSDEVQSIVNELTAISDDFPQQWEMRWEYLIPEMAAFDETDQEEFSEFFSGILAFYRDAASQGNAVMISISG